MMIGMSAMMSRSGMGHKATAAVAVLVLMTAALVPVSGALDDDDGMCDGSDAIAPVIAYAGWMVFGFVMGFLVDKAVSEPKADTDYTDEVNASIYRSWLETQMNALNNGVAIDTQTLALTQMFWSRSAEVAVSSLWSPGSDMSVYSDRILSDSTFSSNVGNLYRSWESLIDQPFDAMTSWPSDSRDKGYGVSYGFYAGDSTVSVTDSLRYDAGTYVSPAAGADRVFLASAGSESTRGLSTLYVLGTSGTLTAADGTTYNLTKGTYDISEFGPGSYTLRGGPFVGPFIPAGKDAAELSGAFVQISDGELHCLHATDGTVWYDGVAVSDAGVSASWSKGSVSVSVKGCLQRWDGMISSIENIAASTLTAAKAEWMLFDSVGSADANASLTMFIPDLSNLQMTAEQRYLVGLLCMQQNYRWYTGSDMQITADDVSLTSESLQLTVKGGILGSDGSAVAEGAVFTPMGWTHDVQLTAGAQTQWTQQGFAVIWSDDAEGWDGTTDLSKMRVVPLSPGMVLSADTVTYKGTDVPSMVLEVKKIDLVLSSFDRISPPAVPHSDHSLIVMVAMVALGVLVAFMGIRSGRPLGVIAGAAIVAVGALYSGTISDIITGDFHWRWF